MSGCLAHLSAPAGVGVSHLSASVGVGTLTQQLLHAGQVTAGGRQQQRRGALLTDGRQTLSDADRDIDTARHIDTGIDADMNTETDIAPDGADGRCAGQRCSSHTAWAGYTGGVTG